MGPPCTTFLGDRSTGREDTRSSAGAGAVRFHGREEGALYSTVRGHGRPHMGGAWCSAADRVTMCPGKVRGGENASSGGVRRREERGGGDNAAARGVRRRETLGGGSRPPVRDSWPPFRKGGGPCTRARLRDDLGKGERMAQCRRMQLTSLGRGCRQNSCGWLRRVQQEENRPVQRCSPSRPQPIVTGAHVALGGGAGNCTTSLPPR